MTNIQKQEQMDRVIHLISESPCVMHFQPIIDSSTNDIVGFEALFRGFKDCPTTELNFEKILTQDRRAWEIWELDIACMASALRQGCELAIKHRLFINVHACTISKIVENKCAILLFMKAIGIDPGSIIFEISEDTDFACVPSLIEDVKELRADGVRVAIDNVKTNFKWFQNMPGMAPIYLKIDRLYIADIAVLNVRQFFVESICLLTRELGLHVIAVGVENEEACRVLESLGVFFMQGFHMGGPLNAERWLVKNAAAGLP